MNFRQGQEYTGQIPPNLPLKKIPPPPGMPVMNHQFKEEKPPGIQLPKFGQVIQNISNPPQPPSSMPPQYGNQFFNSFTSMCNPFSYHIRYGTNPTPTPPHAGTFTTPISGRPVPNERFMQPLVPSLPFKASQRNQKVEGKGNHPRRRKICEKFLRLPYSPKGDLGITLNNKHHIELIDGDLQVKFKYIKYRNITAPSGELVYKEHCCSERKKQKCNARIIERLKDGFCCLQGKHICGGTPDFSTPPPIPPTTKQHYGRTRKSSNFSRSSILDEEEEEEEEDDDDDDELPMIKFEEEDEEEDEDLIQPPKMRKKGMIPAPIPPTTAGYQLPSTTSPGFFNCTNNEIDVTKITKQDVNGSPIEITGVLPYSSAPRTTIHLFVKSHPVMLSTQNLRVYFAGTMVENKPERILIPCLIPTQHSVWKNEYNSDYCVYCVVPEIPGIVEPTLVDITVLVNLSERQKVIGKLVKCFEYLPVRDSKKRKKFRY